MDLFIDLIFYCFFLIKADDRRRSYYLTAIDFLG